MEPVSLLNSSTIKSQLDFIRGYEKFISEAIFGYLFENLTLRQIEIKYLGTDLNGFFSKAVLNGMGMDTSSSGPSNNKGIYKIGEFQDVVRRLLSNPDPMQNNIGHYLEKIKYMFA